MSSSTSASSSSDSTMSLHPDQNDSYQLLHHASLLNSAGVTSMTTNSESDSCFHAFNEALCVMEKLSACPSLQKIGCQVPRVGHTVPAPRLQDDRFFVCPQALLFTADDKPVISEVDLSFYSASIIFNMALAYHQKALLNYNGDSTLVQNALQLYDHCYQILSTILSPPGDDTDMLKLITLNNQAQIHYMTQDFRKAAALLQQLRDLCPLLLNKEKETSGYQRSSHSPSSLEFTPPGTFHSPQTMKEIGMNVLLVTGPPFSAPSG